MRRPLSESHAFMLVLCSFGLLVAGILYVNLYLGGF